MAKVVHLCLVSRTRSPCSCLGLADILLPECSIDSRKAVSAGESFKVLNKRWTKVGPPCGSFFQTNNVFIPFFNLPFSGIEFDHGAHRILTGKGLSLPVDRKWGCDFQKMSHTVIHSVFCRLLVWDTQQNSGFFCAMSWIYLQVAFTAKDRHVVNVQTTNC